MQIPTPGPESYAWGWQQYATLAAALVIYLALAFKNKLPTVESFGKFVSLVDSRGGNILLLTILSYIFFRSSMHLAYYLMALPEEVSKATTISTAAFSFASGTAFGGAFGALLKSLTGQETNRRSTDPPLTNPSTTPPAAPQAQTTGDNPK